MPQSENRLLASLSPEAFDQLRPHLISIELKHGAVMTRPNERFERCISRSPDLSRSSSN